MRYLVTGGCGFIGSHLVDLLVQKGYEVRVLDNLSNSTKQYLPSKADFILGSVSDSAIWEQALKGVDGVFHLAAIVSVPETVDHWHKSHQVNCGGSVSLLEAAKNIPIIMGSTAAIYGNANTLPHQETTPPQPLSPYAIDKYASEMHAQIAWELKRTPSVAFRFFNVYGPRQNPKSSYSGVIARFTDQILRGEPIIIFGDGTQQRDFIYVEDVAKILVKMMETPFKGAHTYNLCTGRSFSINDLADLIGKLTQREVKKQYAPRRMGDILVSQGDPNKIFKEAGLKAEVPLEIGLRNYLQNLK